MSLLEMSFSGAILVLTILAVRAVLKNRLPKITFTVLWMVALLRLLVPFSIPSAWSVYAFLPSADSVTEQAQRFAQGVYEKYAGERAGNDFLDTSLLQRRNEAGSTGESGGPSVQELATDQISLRDQETLTEPNTSASAFSAKVWDKEGAASGKASIAGAKRHRLPVWNIIWAAGLLFCTAYFTCAYLRCYREFQMSLPINEGMLRNWYSTHPLKRKLSVRQSDQIDSPLSYGIWHPVILLPKSTKWEDGFQLRYVLEHEYVHIQHFDAAIKLLAAAALCVHWFNPLVWLMYIFFNRDLELYCDETVIRRFGEEEKSAYAMTLIELEEEKSGVVLLGNSFSKNAIEERIRAIMKIKKMSLLACGMAAVLVGGITLLFATSCKAYGKSEKTSEVDVQEYSTASGGTKEERNTKLLASAVSNESTAIYNEEEIKKLKTELQKREKELDKLIQVKEAQLSVFEGISSNVQKMEKRKEVQAGQEAVEGEDTLQKKGAKQSASDSDMDALVQEIGQLKEERVSLQDVEADLEWYDFVEGHYKEFGIHYHFPEDRLYSVNTPIRYFYDEKNGGVLWADNEGQVVLEVIYDKQGKILCLSGGPAESDEAVDEFFTDGAAEAVHEGKAARAREAGEVAVVVENVGKDSTDIAYAISKSKEFSEYKKCGISYDKKTGYLMYEGKTVGYFMDETAPGVYTRFVDGSGSLGITVVRDLGEIVRIDSFPFDEADVSDASVGEDKDYDGDTTSIAMGGENIEYIEYSDEIVSEAAVSEAAYDSGDDVESSIPAEYAELGLTTDKKTNQWMYHGKGVAVIYDKDYWIYSNSSITERNAVYLEVERDKKGRVTALHEVTKKEMQNLLQED